MIDPATVLSLTLIAVSLRGVFPRNLLVKAFRQEFY